MRQARVATAAATARGAAAQAAAHPVRALADARRSEAGGPLMVPDLLGHSDVVRLEEFGPPLRPPAGPLGRRRVAELGLEASAGVISIRNPIGERQPCRHEPQENPLALRSDALDSLVLAVVIVLASDSTSFVAVRHRSRVIGDPRHPGTGHRDPVRTSHSRIGNCVGLTRSWIHIAHPLHCGWLVTCLAHDDGRFEWAEQRRDCTRSPRLTAPARRQVTVRGVVFAQPSND